MKKIVIAAAVVAHLTVTAQAGEVNNGGARARDPAVGGMLTPRPGSAVRNTVGAVGPQVPGDGRMIDGRIIVEERASGVAPQNCIVDAPRAECAR